MSSELENIVAAAATNTASTPTKVVGRSASEMAQPAFPQAQSQTPEQVSKEVAERIRLASEAANQKVADARKDAAKQAEESAPAVDIEAKIKEILEKMAPSEPTTKVAPEPDWATLTELEATDLRKPLNIPLITHEIPSYLEVRLADNEYIVVWANRDQRRLGELEVQGYEFLKKEHIAKDYKTPLKFDSEGLYIYADVIAMRVHKRILFGKRRKIQQQSVNQLKGAQQIAKEKVKSTVVARDTELEGAFERGSFGFYDVNV